MKKLITYYVAEGSSPEKLGIAVRELIGRGWEPQGSASGSCNPGVTWSFVQAMDKYQGEIK